MKITGLAKLRNMKPSDDFVFKVKVIAFNRQYFKLGIYSLGYLWPAQLVPV